MKLQDLGKSQNLKYQHSCLVVGLRHSEGLDSFFYQIGKLRLHYKRLLTLSQTTDFRLFQIERVCQQQFHI